MSDVLSDVQPPQFPVPADAPVPEVPSVGASGADVTPWLRAHGQTLDATKSNWCGAFTNAYLHSQGLPGLPTAQGQIATNWSNYGSPVTGSPQPNDVLVEPRGLSVGRLGGHVGIATGETRTNPDTGQTEYQMRSGNYSDGKVGLSWEPSSTLVVRRAGDGTSFPDRIAWLGERSGGSMEVTPETATNPGLGVTPAKDQSPSELHRVGVDYANALLKRYNGNESLAAAAYNAGPDQVDKWISAYGDPRSGGISNSDWVSKIPNDTTRQYAMRVTGGQLGIPGQPSLDASAIISGMHTAQAGMPGYKTAGGVGAIPEPPGGAGGPPRLQMTVPPPKTAQDQVAAAAATSQPTSPADNMRKMMALSLLQQAVGRIGHTLTHIDYDPFKVEPAKQESDFRPGGSTFRPYAVSIGRGEVSGVSKLGLPGMSQSTQGLMERLLGQTGYPSQRGHVGGGSSSEYGLSG